MRWFPIILLLIAAQSHAQTRPADVIRDAKSPSEAIEAYARAGDADAATKQAYIRRMIDFGTPELAEAQAKDLTNANVHDPLAIGVAAYMSAARGEMGAAVQQLKMALQFSPQESFLLRTAGQIVAWYDTATDRSRLTPTDVQALESIRTTSASQPAFADAYRAASSPQQTTQPIVQSPPPAQYVEPAPPTVIYTTRSYDYYPNYYPGYVAYPIYTNPFHCVTPRPWHPTRFAGFSSAHHHHNTHVHSRTHTSPTFRSVDRGTRYGNSSRNDIRPAPVFRGSTSPRQSTASSHSRSAPQRSAPFRPAGGSSRSR